MGESSETIEVSLRDENRNSKPSLVTTEAIATFEEVEPESLSIDRGIRLYDHVDPDALDKLVSGDGDVSVRLDIEGYQVEMTNSKLTVEEA
ncbi:uncharacterized protein Nmag_1041 [Natrialba magadii ATCC 43099]|uniref:Halobacterial output domain-containing protein n=1 Tax=Natrialba magadii (strain ATCC 43099 / DSM 3394 / CCM 3739 / CIP 104546 / IAM 13178 / JCM 8861 / NBRC 102185 / NCIMB 2190 / MS3) TaxID=547559 RepID=D3SRC0_NATMM|nr:HalOD1 output domain-containing protein [Natrialba magadii]ADD04625.1 uncharacterized protein Nmag_1041 [Natrialba magadii ATCC 43099]ELY25280.1 hypothetical protein C500_17721 [Natrialba magadii ATCC 43099]